MNAKKCITILNKINVSFILTLVFLFQFSCQQIKNDKVKEQKKNKSLAELQLEFANTRYQAYFHYNMCTFKNLNEKERFGRSTGKEPPTMWNPTGLDCEQWAQVCINAKMEGGWLTTKHHGGFCLWDSKYTDYDVASSPVKTDVLIEFVDAFRAAGLKVGFYYSILDYYHGVVNGEVTKEEIEFLKNQITELLTGYGPIDYINFDGWATWPTVPTFDDVPYPELFNVVKAIQPECIIVNHQYESNLSHAEVPFADAAGRKYPYHPDYMRPTAGSDFLQRGWWWDNNNDMRVTKSVEYILDRLNSYNSHNGVYILNISPNPAGRIDDDAIERLMEVAAVWEKPAPLKKAGENWGYQYDITENLAFLKPATQSSVHPFLNDKRAYPRAEIAVDGVTEGHCMMEQTSLTNKDENAWWQVDLQRECAINEIIIYNRTDSCMNCLSDYMVHILDTDSAEVWSNHQADYPNPSVSLNTGGIIGQYINIRLNGTNNLSLAEVIVKGTKQ